MFDSLKRPLDLLDSSEGELKSLVGTIRKLGSLNDALKRYLPENLASHCQVANLSQGKLTLTVDSNAFASKLYYEKFNLLSQLRQTPEFAGLSHIEHRIDPDLFKSIPTPKPPAIDPPKISDGTRQSLITLIANADQRLKTKLEVLLSRFS